MLALQFGQALNSQLIVFVVVYLSVLLRDIYMLGRSGLTAFASNVPAVFAALNNCFCSLITFAYIEASLSLSRIKVWAVALSLLRVAMFTFTVVELSSLLSSVS